MTIWGDKMGKKLSEMSLEELRQLFPIQLTEHKPCWKDWYAQEEAVLRNILSTCEMERISHIGSTAIESIWAKPIIDILVEVSDSQDFNCLKYILVSSGYICMSQSENRMSFNKGYTENGFAEKVFHLHVRRAGDHDELYFRDYLREHPAASKEYEQMKLALWRKYEHDRDGYTNAKTEFVLKCTQEAKKLYGKRY